ncbi:MAG TPA: D-2-hydroxyacid dehydrogenase [Candidatus Binataceae bacterium]|nr:D-2-hydroxyacid dehydrogenase [Candidatus Binataceae bacterium]
MKILSTVGLTPAEIKQLEQLSGGAEIVDRRCRSQAEMIEAAAGGCDVLFSFRAPDALIRQAPGLKWIQFLSAGADHVMKGELHARPEIAITNASGIHSTPIAEYTIASMLAWSHGFHVTLRAQIRREWKRNWDFMDSVDSLRGKTLGVIGYGSIGRETARMGQALGMTVLALKRNPDERRDTGWSPPGIGDPEGLIPARWYGPDGYAEILRDSDFITVTLPATTATRRVIGRAEIAVMRPHAYLVNIGRGEVIDQEALIEALREKRIGGAGLDVFEREPLEPESPLWDLENAILTPHMSGSFKGYNSACCELFAENLGRFVKGEPLLNVVDRELGY